MKHLYTILLGCVVLLGPVSCMKIDNFEAPAAKIQGRIIDKTTGQPMLLDHGVSHIRIWEMSYSEHPTPPRPSHIVTRSPAHTAKRSFARHASCCSSSGYRARDISALC